MVEIQKDIPLAPFTTVGLGGPARFFATCTTVEEIIEAVTYARNHGLPIHILGGGSNTIFSDDGFRGLVIHVNMTGVTFTTQPDTTLVRAAAGEVWEALVAQVVGRGLAGLECLSGIPGLVGATPMQNVGAYGQEVSETIDSVEVLDLDTMELQTYTNAQCAFAYRTSMFKRAATGKYVVIAATFRLRNNGQPTVKYEQVASRVKELHGVSALGSGSEALARVRAVVLELRRLKSMVIDADDPNTRSCGSFFVNPVVSAEVFERIQAGSVEPVPHFPAPEGITIPGAWLIEHAGFPRGYRQGGVGISTNHNLALVNFGGTAAELLQLADVVKAAVDSTYGIQLELEPVVIPTAPAVE